VISSGRLIYDPLNIGASLRKRASDRLAAPRRRLSDAERCDRVQGCYDALLLARSAANGDSPLAIPLAQVAAMECFHLFLRDANIWPTDLLGKLDRAMSKRHPIVEALLSLQRPGIRKRDVLDSLESLERVVLGRSAPDAVVHCFGSRRVVRGPRPPATNRRVRADLLA
jgi:hypothetical protein